MGRNSWLAVGMVLLALATGGITSRLSFGNPVVEEQIFAGRVRLVLPPTIYAIPELECNLYFDNVILTLNADNYAFHVTCPVGFQYRERWAYSPTAEELGEYPLTVEVRDDSNTLVGRVQSTLRVVAAEAPAKTPATLLMLGASFTEYSVYPRHVLELSERDGAARLRLIGSRGPGNMPPTGNLRHEGYSGWTAEAFAILSGPLSRSGYHVRGATGSPFVYETEEGVKSVDFARYCLEFNDGEAPDLVTIQVGTNDVFTATDKTIDETIDQVFTHYDALIVSIRAAGADTCIGVQMVTPPSTSQDGFRNYRGLGRQTRWQFRRNQHRLMERLLEHFGDRTAENIFLVPSYINLDAANHFPTWSPNRNSRSDQKVTRVNNGTHPSEPGYQQIGDVVYSWAVHMLSR